MTPIDLEKQAVFGCLRGSISCEGRQLRARLSACFDTTGLRFRRDVELPFNGGTIDFLSELGFAVLVAGAGEGLDDMFLRARMVAVDERVNQLLVITTRAVHRKLPGGMCGKPLDVIWLGGLS